MPRKQRHTARRVHERLVEECGFEGSYSSVQRWVKRWRQRHRGEAEGFSELEWAPGSAQVDFGQALAVVAGVERTVHFLVVSFPYSNMRYVAALPGETAECVCHGLNKVFSHAGMVPRVLVFDNATGVGHRRADGTVTQTRLFSRFRAHYHFRVRFCNPYSGWEKGNVERKVDYNRANLFVPVPHFNEIEKYNRKLLARHEKKASELHYKKQIPIRELFEEDRKALLMLPPKRFDVCRYEWLKADGYGKVCMDGKHFYSTRPENANKQVLVGIRAHTVDILTEGGQVVTTHRRAYGDNRTDISDYSTTLAVLMKNSGAWGNSGQRYGDGLYEGQY